MIANPDPAIKFPAQLNTQSLQYYVDGLVEKYAIPALSIAIWHKKKLHQAAAGILNIETGINATTDSVFQIGSVTKLFTATLIMQLVDNGHLNLDQPVKHYLRDFQVADPEVTRKVTIRQLLNHTNGLTGDYFADDPVTGGNLIARFVDRCCLLPQAHPLGIGHSYSNVAYVVAGRLIEVITGVSWFEAIDSRIIKPLKLSHSFCQPTESLRHRSAIGHIPDPSIEGDWKLAHTCYPPLGMAPAGTTLSMSAADLIAFTRAHLNEGLLDSNVRLLSKESVLQMQCPSVNLPALSSPFVTDWGLGWFIANGQHNPVIGHDGATFGQSCVLRMVPCQNFAYVAQMNCHEKLSLNSICNESLATLLNISFKPPIIIKEPIDINSLTGTYDSFDGTITISTRGSELIGSRVDKVSPSAQIENWSLRAIGEDTLAVFSEKSEYEGNITFIERDAESVPKYLYFGFRLHQRQQI